MRVTRRSGNSFTEIVVAAAVLGGVAVSLIGGSQSSVRSAQGADRRMVLELRARRWQAEVLTTTFEAAVSTAGTEYPMTLSEPTQPPGYAAHVSDLNESTQVDEIDSGLLAVTTRLGWDESASGKEAPRSITVTRLMANPTLSLQTRVPLTPVEP